MIGWGGFPWSWLLLALLAIGAWAWVSAHLRTRWENAQAVPPPEEIDALLTAAMRAEGLADEGDVESGRILLSAGLRRAEEQRSAGVPWGTELSERFRVVLQEFEATWSAGPPPARRVELQQDTARSREELLRRR